VRILLNIRSGTALVSTTSAAPAASLAAFPLLVMLSLSWIWQPISPLGRGVATLVFGTAILFLASLAWSRRRKVPLPAGSELRWESALDGDDPYRVLVHHAGTATLLLEHDDPAIVLRDLVLVLAETGLRLVCPAEIDALLSARARERKPIAVRTATSVVGKRWATQQRAAMATIGGAIFTLFVFFVSARAESGLSALSLALPLVSIFVVGVLGTLLAVLRVEASLGPEGFVVDHVLFGLRRRTFAAAPDSLLDVSAIGHAGFPERDVIVETRSGFFSVPLAGDAARRIAAHASTYQPAETRARARSPESFEGSRVTL
jgi:hypothetical protein